MATNTSQEVYDLLLLVDATYSMSSYLQALRISFPKIISISKLTDGFDRIGLLAYRDYTEKDRTKNGLLEWSGWYSHGEPEGPDSTSAEGLMQMASDLEAMGGGDLPEATKTGLAKAYSLMRENATTVILLYTDAPPHCYMVAEKDRGSNYNLELSALGKAEAYGGFGNHFTDWVEASKLLHSGPRKAHVFCFMNNSMGNNSLHSSYYLYLSTITRGACMYLTNDKPHSIAQVTVDVLLAWMGVEKAGVEKTALPATLFRYSTGTNIKQIKHEKDTAASSYFWSHNPTGSLANAFGTARGLTLARETLNGNQVSVAVDSDVLKKYLPKRKTPTTDFAQSYLQDEQYKQLAVVELANLIKSDVTSIALNPVFGSLWRVVCNDRSNPARNDLINAFSASLEKIKDADERARMKNWLEESYDYAADILHELDEVPEEKRFPCVYLDPTIAFQPAKEKESGEEAGEEEEDEREITAFRRDELLDIGRSCDGRILRRLGKVLTRLTYAHSADDLPAHVRETSNAEVPKLPLCLASKEMGWRFWKILLHTVKPGTMLSARPATVLAALAIRIGLMPLFDAATAALLFWRDKWNNLEVPETWNAGCLGLLLDADDEFRKQKGEIDYSQPGLLLPTDRQLFSQLVTYKLAEINLHTNLIADVSWRPEKTLLPVGHAVTCSRCRHTRSVTIMAEKSNGQCGLCACEESQLLDAEDHKASIAANANESKLAWVECSVRTCRAQYVCYNVSKLTIDPKCHYCRMNQGAAPTVECTKCLSKVIWPKEFRTTTSAPFHCVACIDGVKTVISVDTTAKELCSENGSTWLLQNTNGTLSKPFEGSLFKTISSATPDAFLANVRIFPDQAQDARLTLRGKPIQNQHALIANLKSWITSRRAEKTPCSLCFTDIPNARLLPACRRRGCHQRVCSRCLGNWYGVNRVGCIINPSALCCPFCRRPATAKTLATYGRGIHAVGNLMPALREQGTWIHAWCRACGQAERFMERECARGAPEPVENFTCDGCTSEKLEAARLAELEAERAAHEAREVAGARAHRQEALRLAAAMRELRIAQRARAELDYPVKKCPGCGVRSQKVNGCDHVTCPVSSCGVHWCWRCREACSQQDIYDHMKEKHGGWSTDEGAWGGHYYNWLGRERVGMQDYSDYEDYDF